MIQFIFGFVIGALWGWTVFPWLLSQIIKFTGG